jgi:16S rRNA (uracil1498-N3)-methyltransferase
MSSTHRILVDCDALNRGQIIRLPQSDSHHLLRVLRLGVGASVSLICKNSGQSALASIQSESPTLEVRVESVAEPLLEQSKIGTLLFALSKGSKNDFVCEKACELGARHIILWQSDHSVVKLDHKDASAKLLRWNKITKSAAEQSSNTNPCQVHLALSLEQATQTLLGVSQSSDLFLICSLRPNAVPMRALGHPENQAHLAIGPEGDFSEREENALIEFGFKPVNLGPRVLRCETAAVVALAAVEALWGAS